MKAIEAHKMSDQELVEEEQRLRRRLFDLRSQAVTEKLDNPRQMQGIRQDINVNPGFRNVGTIVERGA